MMWSYLEEFARKYGAFAIMGVVGAVIHRLRNKMSWTRFLSAVFVSVFTAFCAGVFAQDHFGLPSSVTYAICGIAGHFSESILDEIRELIRSGSDIVKAKLGVDTSTHHDTTVHTEVEENSESNKNEV